jgi:hypothetical protein
LDQFGERTRFTAFGGRRIAGPEDERRRSDKNNRRQSAPDFLSIEHRFALPLFDRVQVAFHSSPLARAS